MLYHKAACSGNCRIAISKADSLPPGHSSLHSSVTLSWCKQEEGVSSKQLPTQLTFSAPYSTTCSADNLLVSAVTSVLMLGCQPWQTQGSPGHRLLVGSGTLSRACGRD